MQQQPKQETFRYTSMCRFHLAGRCERGEDCFFAHEESQLREKPDLYRTRICRSYAKTGKCKEGPGCRFAHSQDEMRNQDGGLSASESMEDGWARTESSWSMDEGDGAYMTQWMGPSMGYCPMWPQYGGFQVMGWMPNGEMGWFPCQWQDMQTEETGEKEEKLAWDPINAEPDAAVEPEDFTGLAWDPIGKGIDIDVQEGLSELAVNELSWDPLSLGAVAEEEIPIKPSGTRAPNKILDPEVVLLAARSLEKKRSAAPVKRASFFSLPSTVSTAVSEAEKVDEDETDSVFEAWAVMEDRSTDDIIMHKGVGYEVSIRNTFISFGVADAAKRMLHRSHSEPSLNDRD
eukprot:CAMPEP_0181413682 /NCGR_PEP_ID=MMETSP1110-20121109/9104_1 /TAXON_ID=174948 /ORGANISM="Symbiodinium sp., Strain CCMP421" /LENGTH=345 /DNA_ID=CAMNT_0023536515 /DNA_START=78 /DNA_END=1115 /DNA_ORIENTATION=+